MNYIKISPNDIANGPGVRVVLWIAGCVNCCPGCHNPDTWDRNAGSKLTDPVLHKLAELVNRKHIQGITLSGGDPLAPFNRAGTAAVLHYLRENCPGKDIWLYSGHRFEELTTDPWADEALSLVDVLVDGKFEQDRKDISLLFRGSSNQRLIDMRPTWETGDVHLWDYSKLRTA